MTAPSETTEKEALRLRALAQVGAGRAARALADLLGPVWKTRTQVVGSTLTLEGVDDATLVVIFEMEGAVGGLVGIFLPPAARDRVVSALVPEEENEQSVIESALREAANIVASQAVSAIADFLGDRITLSIPVLVQEQAAPAFAQRLAERSSRRLEMSTESELRDPAAALHALLVLSPDAI